MDSRRWSISGGLVATAITLAVAFPVQPAATAEPRASTSKTQVLRLEIETTSDWATVSWSGLQVRGNANLNSRSPGTTVQLGGPSSVNVQFDVARLMQSSYPLPRGRVTITQQFSVPTRASGLRVTVAKGHVGYVEIRIVDGRARTVLAEYRHEGISSSKDNSRTFVTPASVLTGARPSDTLEPAGTCPADSKDNASVPGIAATVNPNILVAQDNLWFHGLSDHSAFSDPRDPTTPVNDFRPLLGFYDKSKRTTSEQSIDLAVDNGIDAFSQEWIAPRGEPGSMEADMDDAFLEARNLCRMRWAIFYDLNLRAHWSYPGDYANRPPDFDDPRIREFFVDDFVHFARKYFAHPQYLEIDGRPVVEIWATWHFQGSYANLRSTVSQAREAVRKLGYDVYIVGDEQATGPVDLDRVALWDATSSFIPPLMGGQSPFAGVDNGDRGLRAAIEFVDVESRKWHEAIAGVTTVGAGRAVTFQPGFAPQYDDIAFGKAVGEPGRTTSLLAMSNDEIRQLAEVAKKHADLVGASQRRIIWVGTWNGYPESTNIEPTIASANPYPGGNYGHDITDILQEIFGSETFG